MRPSLFRYFLIVVAEIHFPALETFPVLLLSCFFQYLRQCVAEVHCADFFPFGCPDFHFVAGGIVTHTPDGKVLFLKVDVLPCQPTDLTNA